jgi:L-asparagine transporter-like permease
MDALGTSGRPSDRTLRRELGIFGAMMLGLGAMIETGVLVGIGVAAGVSGPSVALAAVVAAFLHSAMVSAAPNSPLSTLPVAEPMST